jgi:hypothetical protein
VRVGVTPKKNQSVLKSAEIQLQYALTRTGGSEFSRLKTAILPSMWALAISVFFELKDRKKLIHFVRRCNQTK